MNNQGSSGTYTMSGGTLNVKNNNANQPQLIVGRAGTGTMNISGNAVVNVNNGAQIQLGVGTVFTLRLPSAKEPGMSQ